MKRFVLSLVFAVAATVMFATPTNAVDHTITIDDAHAEIDQVYDFQHSLVAPGSVFNTEILIINNATTMATVTLELSLINQVVPPSQTGVPNDMLPFVNYVYLVDNVVLVRGDRGAFGNLQGAKVCIPASGQVTLTARLEMPASVGNAAQDTSLWTEALFHIETAECEIDTPDPVDPTDPEGPPITPPNTVKSALPLTIVGTAVGLSFVVMLASFLIMLFLFLAKRRRNDDEKAEMARQWRK